MLMFKVITFYKFTALADCWTMKDQIKSRAKELGVMGTLLLAEEGINSTVAGTPESIDIFFAFLREYPQLADLTAKTSSANKMPFRRFKIRVKKEIVTMKTQVNPAERVGHYVDAKAWNDLIQQDGVIVIDTRNDYEVEVGTFPGAVNPKTEFFSQFPEFVKNNLDNKRETPIAMYCTGGIRCEKATSYLLQQGFKNVYHLDGGILKYLEEIPPEQNLWQGECFVFDDRRSLSLGLKLKS